MKTVKCFDDESNKWEDVSLITWASDICFGFFYGLKIFSPFEIAKRFTTDPSFSKDVMLGNSDIEWQPFDLSEVDYDQIKKYFDDIYKLKYFNLENILTANDYIMWRREKRYGVPFNIQKEFYSRFDKAMENFKSLENDSDKYLSAWNELNELINEEKNLIEKYKDTKS